jgi:transglutaminase-like putative cysteine protease
LSAKAQEYLPFTIPDSLKTDAYSVIRNKSLILTQSDINNATLEVTKVITVLDRRGEDMAVFSMYEDKFQEFKKFSGKIFDMTGKVIKKIKQSDLLNTSLSEETINMDGRTYYYKPQSPVYPYTVEYTYQINYKNGIRGYYPLVPYNGYYQSVEKYEYTLNLPADINLRYKSNCDIPVKGETIGGKQVYSFSLKGLKATPYEILSPGSNEIHPRILLAPSDFCYDSYCGNMSDWKKYGAWSTELLKGRDDLPPNIIQNLQEITNGAKNDREKVKILYQHLQEHFRYVNIALGIGGYQPIDASTTYKNRFGDCKGLTNVMKAMLKAVGIPSHYTLISMRQKDIYKDYPNFNQLDHVILMVPFEKDSVWLECTSSVLPFGYLHDEIAGHNAIIVHEDGKGGEYCTLPTYPENENRSDTHLTINIDETGKAKGQMNITENLHYYTMVAKELKSKDRDRHIKYLNYNANMPKIKYGDISISENRSELPSYNIVTNFEADDFANKTGSRIFVPLCPLKKGNFNVPNNENRLYDIVINDGFSVNDSIVYNIPETYTVESLPKNIEIETPFGKLRTQTVKKDTQIIFTQNVLIHQGRYDKSEYKELQKFYSQITSASKQKFVLKKTE